MEEIGTCFIINECNFKDDIIKDVKYILLNHNYGSIIAEELPAYNVDLLEHKVLKPMEQADFVIVLLSPKGKKKKDANFNVAFEFGYARGMDKDVILLFDGKANDLPSDIKGDYAISLYDNKWREELNKLIEKQIKETQRKFVDLPEEIVTQLEKGIGHNTFDIFANLLQKFSYGFKILDNPKVFKMILKIFEEKKYQIASGEPALNLLMALNTILYLDRGKKSTELKEELLKYLPIILKDSNQEAILQQTLILLIKMNNENAVMVFKQFIIEKNGEKLRSVLNGLHLDFANTSDIEFCNLLLKELASMKSEPSQHGLSNLQIQVIDGVWNNLINDIRQKYTPPKTRVKDLR